MQLRVPVLPAMTAVSVWPVKMPASAGSPSTSAVAPSRAASRGDAGSRSMAGRSPVMTWLPCAPGTAVSASAMACSTMRVAACVSQGGTSRMSIHTLERSATT